VLVLEVGVESNMALEPLLAGRTHEGEGFAAATVATALFPLYLKAYRKD
jgi:hypothetical protein